MSKELVRAAQEARGQAYAPYSQFRVGAAARSDDGSIVTGCNVENAAYGLTVCAERVAILKAVSEGKGPLVEICVVADSEGLTPPCGSCRQVIWELCGDIPIVMADLKGHIRVVNCRDLLPMPFERRQNKGAKRG